MAKTSPSSQKSPAVARNVESVELLHLAQLFLDIRLDHHQASLLTDLINAATEPHPDSDANGPSATAPGPSAAPARSGVSAPPAYATQQATSAGAASISVVPSNMAATVISPPAAPAPSPVMAPAPTPVLNQAPAAPHVVAPVMTAATPPAVAPAAASNHGYAPYQVLPVGFPYERPTLGTPGPYYAITRGRVVGVVAGWDKASPHCIGVGGAVFRSVPSIDMGKHVVETALNAGSCMLLP